MVDWPKGAWSHSHWSSVRKCTRLAHLKYDLNLTPVGPAAPALQIGSYFHKALEAVGRNAMHGYETSRATWVSAMQEANMAAEDVDARLDGMRLVGAYSQHYGHENAGYGPGVEIHGVELVLTGGDLHAAIGGFAAIADAWVEDLDGHMLYEHKTAARMPSGSPEDQVRHLKSRPQYPALAFCFRATHGFIPRVCHNLVTKTKTVGLRRNIIEFTDMELDDWAASQRELEPLAQLNFQNRDACAPTFGPACDFFHYCHGTEEEREQLYQIRVREH